MVVSQCRERWEWQDGDVIFEPDIRDRASHRWVCREKWEDHRPLIWVPFLALPLRSCVTWAKALSPGNSVSSSGKWGLVYVPALLQGINVLTYLKQYAQCFEWWLSKWNLLIAVVNYEVWLLSHLEWSQQERSHVTIMNDNNDGD